MQEYYIVRQPQPVTGAWADGNPFQQMQFMPPGQVPGFTPRTGFPQGQGPGFRRAGNGFRPGQGRVLDQVFARPVPGFGQLFPPGQVRVSAWQVPGGGVGMGPPLGRPPQFIPSQAAAQQTAGVLAVDPGAIRPCRFRFVYLWLDTGSSSGHGWYLSETVRFRVEMDRVQLGFFGLTWIGYRRLFASERIILSS